MQYARFQFSLILLKVTVINLCKVYIHLVWPISIKNLRQIIHLIFIGSIYFICFYFLLCILLLFAKRNFVIIVFYNCCKHLLSCFQLFQIILYFIYSFCKVLLCFCQFFLLLHFKLLLNRLKINNNIIFSLINFSKSTFCFLQHKIYIVNINLILELG